ncbi:SLC45A2 [Brachionus plicatilis]|uniref:SLC45A2 n=1 Tax=Brachionus plicatilis TaxID=10195 RepID=A0A3M7RV27_BRAPC|nr:SLC45A2 [Brachionus plicatilis]
MSDSQIGKRSSSALIPSGSKTNFRSATAFEKTSTFRSNLSTNNRFQKRYMGSNLLINRSLRSKSAINFIKRPQSRITSKHAEDSQLYDDFSDEKPKRSIFTLARIGMVYFGIEVLFSLEIALTVPILLKLKVPEEVYSLVYFLSPLIGFIFQPVLGVMSDRCQSKWGRRRPFILVLSIFAFIGASLILNAYLIGQWLGDQNSKIPKIAIFLVGLGVTFLDFSADSSDSPLRALLLDVCNTEDQDTGLNIHAFLGGTGGAVGYILAGIDWTDTFFRFIGDETQILFVFAGVIFLSTLLATITSVKETPLVLDEEKIALLTKNEITSLPDDLMHEENCAALQVEDDEDDDEDKPVTLKMLYQSVLKMPRELIRLLVCNLLGWLAFFSTSLFFTDFIGQAIYHGDAYAPQNSTEFALYNQGVKMGCWCLLTYSLVSAISAVILEKFLMEKFSTRTLYFFSYLVYALCCIGIYFQTNIYIIMPLSSSIGIVLTAISTLPYQMLSEFHKDNRYRSQSAAGTKRGLGIDCSLLSSIYFLAQTIVSAVMSLITSNFGNYSILIIGALFSLLGCFWIALFVIFPEDQTQKKSNDYQDNEKD